MCSKEGNISSLIRANKHRVCEEVWCMLCEHTYALYIFLIENI